MLEALPNCLAAVLDADNIFVFVITYYAYVKCVSTSYVTHEHVVQKRSRRAKGRMRVGMFR